MLNWHVVSSIFVYVVISLLMGSFFHYILKKNIIGGVLGGIFLSFIGAVLANFFIGDVFLKVITFMENGLAISKVHVLSGLCGGYLMLYMFDRMNH